MNSHRSNPIPPPGERDDYICKLDHRKPGLWILKREEHVEAFQNAISSGLTEEESIEQLGGIFYASGKAQPSCIGSFSNIVSFPAADITKPSVELLKAAEAAYALLDQDPVKFVAALKASEIEKFVWIFILNIGPWFRPREATFALPDTNGPGLWLLAAPDEDLLKIVNNRELGEDDEALLKRHGTYYSSRKCTSLSSIIQRSNSKCLAKNVPTAGMCSDPASPNGAEAGTV
jgi:hypothetical protein